MKIYLLLLCLGSAFFYLLFRMYFPCTKSSTVITQYYTLEEGTKKYVYNRSLPIIFIGGMPGSGLTRLSVMLDAHPDVRCGEETGIIPHLLRLNEQWTNYRIEFKRLQAAGIAGKVLDSAMASFILEIIANQGSAAPRLCNKDPFTLLSAVYLHSLFPRAKFVFLIRDGRAVVHSMITKNVSIADFDLNDYRQCLSEWNAKMLAMFSQCLVLGSEICMPVHYEQIVLQPEPSMRSIANFLDIPWSKSVLHPDELVKLEYTIDSFKPINDLTKWVGNIPEDVVRDMVSLAPMLSTLGYDPYANPPKYEEHGSFVIKNRNFVKMLWYLKVEMQREI